VSSFNAQHVTLQTAKGVVWKIDKTATTKVTGTLQLRSTVAVEFSKKNGRQIKPGTPKRGAGKRTEETGRVIGLTTNLITLDNTTPDPGTWFISRTDGNTVLVSGTLTLGATGVHISFFAPPGQQQVNA